MASPCVNADSKEVTAAENGKWKIENGAWPGLAFMWDARMRGTRGMLQVWQAKELRERDFRSVANKGVTGEILEVWQRKGLATGAENGNWKVENGERKRVKETENGKRKVEGGAGWRRRVTAQVTTG